MKINKRTFITIIVLLLFSITACNLPFNLQGEDKDTGQVGATEEPAEEDSGGIFNNVIEVDPDPVGMQEGLGSLDSYKITLQVKTFDETGKTYNVTEFAERSVVDENSHSLTTSISYDPESEEGETTDTMETYTVGLVTCTKSGDEWSYQEVTAQDKELRDIFTSMVDFVPLIDDPQFVGEEEVNGLTTNHFTFTVKGIGDSSGSIASINSGEYWLAKDGQYIVRYHLTLEIRSAAEGTEGAQVGNLEIYADMTDVNMPVSISLPMDCQPE